MSYVLSLRVFLPQATPLPSLSAAAATPPPPPRQYPPMPTPCRRRRMYTIAVGRRRRFAFLSFAAVAGDNGRRLSAELWVGTSMYIRMYTTTHSGRRDSGVARAARAARR